MQPLFTTGTSSPTSTASAGAGGNGNGNGGTSASGTMNATGLSGGQIAGIVVGSVIGAILLLALLICCCIYMRRRKDRSNISSLNQPTPPRSGGQMTQQDRPPPFEALPGARVTRMTALEGGFNDGSPEHGDSSGFNTSPDSQHNNGDTNVAAAAVPMRKKSPADLDGSSPESGDYSSPEGGGGTERMDSHQDYYSDDMIHPGDYVSVLWSYQPRAADEFQLDRGDMLKIVGIWDDAWATAVRLPSKAEDYSPSRRSGRDSVVSSESARAQSSDGDIKAFPVRDTVPSER